VIKIVQLKIQIATHEEIQHHEYPMMVPGKLVEHYDLTFQGDGRDIMTAVGDVIRKAQSAVARLEGGSATKVQS
jgi:hypothetical protein